MSDKGQLSKNIVRTLKILIRLKNGPKILTDTSPKIYRWQIRIQKDVPLSLGEYE